MTAYQLLILCQSVLDTTAENLISQATALYPNIKILALSYDGEHRSLPGSATLMADLYNPSIFREAVAGQLNGRVDGAA